MVKSRGLRGAGQKLSDVKRFATKNSSRLNPALVGRGFYDDKKVSSP